MMYKHVFRLAQTPLVARSQFYSTGKPAIASYYALFPKTFPLGAPPAGPYKAIPKRELKLEYYNLQRDHHPDLNNSNNQEQAATDNHNGSSTADSSANISVAYRTLLDPLRRAQHILATRGFDPLAEDNTTEQQHDEEDNTDMLMAVMMTKEAIFDATTTAELADVQTETAEQVAELVDALDLAFKADDLAKASKLVTRLSYWDGITKQLNEKLGELEPSE